MSWKDPKPGQVSVKCIPVIHVSVRQMLRISKQCKIFQNNSKRALFWPIFIRTDFQSCSALPYNLCPKIYSKMKGLIKLGKPGKFR